ncbi:MAG: class I SAM-dependent methyltransferase [Byssovorax sp.]
MAHETTQHYSQEVELFQRFLDPYMKYSSGLFLDRDEDLDTGILRMLDQQIALACLSEGARVLEIGNGWGSLLKRLQEKAPGLSYLGVNPSAVQQDYIARAVSDRVDLRVAPFEDVMDAIEGPFDAVFMIGSLCHIKDKARVLARVGALLAPGGRLVIEDTFFLSEALYQKHYARPETKFVQNEVFGYAHVFSLAHHFDLVREAGMRVMTTLETSEDYARTIDLWVERIAELDPARFPLAPQFIKYMDVFQRGWGYTICNHLMALERLPERWPPRARPGA